MRLCPSPTDNQNLANSRKMVAKALQMLGRALESALGLDCDSHSREKGNAFAQPNGSRGVIESPIAITNFELLRSIDQFVNHSPHVLCLHGINLGVNFSSPVHRPMQFEELETVVFHITLKTRYADRERRQ